MKGTERLYVVFLGPDGAGKTTIIEALCGRLGSGASRLYLGYGSELWQFRSLQHLYGAHQSAVFLFVFHVFLFPIEILSRRLSHFVRCRRSRIVLVDRLPGRPLLANGLLRFLYRLYLPTPSHVVTLTGDPAVLASRKPLETTVDRTAVDLAKWQEVGLIFVSAVSISVDTTVLSPEETVEAIVEGIPGILAQ